MDPRPSSNKSLAEPLEASTDGSSPRRLRLLYRWRRYGAFGGLVLAAAFFLPVVESCNEPVYPVVGLYEFAVDSDSDRHGMLGWSANLTLYFVPYLMGLLCLIIALRARARQDARPGLIGWALGGTFAFALASLAALAFEWVRDEIAKGNRPAVSAWIVVFAALMVLMAVYLALALRRRDAELLSLRFYVALCCLLWFGMWLFTEGTYFGLWLSILGAAAMAAASVAEASLRGYVSPTAAVGRLLTCRVELHDLTEPRCATCGYLLIGLPEPRCPECGRPFGEKSKSQQVKKSKQER